MICENRATGKEPVIELLRNDPNEVTKEMFELADAFSSTPEPATSHRKGLTRCPVCYSERPPWTTFGKGHRPPSIWCGLGRDRHWRRKGPDHRRGPYLFTLPRLPLEFFGWVAVHIEKDHEEGREGRGPERARTGLLLTRVLQVLERVPMIDMSRMKLAASY